jgi:hypothetical protein
MYYDRRWDREFFDEQSKPHEPTWLAWRLVLLLSPLFLAIIAVTFHLQNNPISDELPFIGWF